MATQHLLYENAPQTWLFVSTTKDITALIPPQFISAEL